MLALNTRYRARDRKHRVERRPAFRNIEIYRVEFHGAPLAKIVGSFSQRDPCFFLVLRESFNTIQLTIQRKTVAPETLAFRSCGDVFHEDLTKRNVSSSTTISGVKLGTRKRAGVVMVNDERADGNLQFPRMHAC